MKHAMDIFADHLRSAIILLGLTGGVFGLIALATKRGKFQAAVSRTWSEFSTNLGLAVINMVLLAPLFVLPEGKLREAIGTPERFALFWDSLPELLTFVAAILIFDFVVYWRHRLEHTPLLWPIHATHHADTAFHWLTTMRKHPLSKLLSASVDFLLLLLLGVPEWAVGLAAIVRSWWAFLVHADVPWTLGILGKVLISPAAHRLHHIRDEDLMGSNYGNTVTLWDKLFGTYVDPAPYLECETGIAEGTRGLMGELLRPFERRYWCKGRSGQTGSEPAV